MIDRCLAIIIVLAALCILLQKYGYFSITNRQDGFVPVRDRCSGGLAQSPITYGVDIVDTPILEEVYRQSFPRVVTVRDGTVAPLTPTEIPNMVRKGLGAGSASIAEYMREDANPETGVTRLSWYRAMADKDRGKAARSRPANPSYQILPNQPGSLVPEESRPDRPMSLATTPNLIAGFADMGTSPNGYNPEFVTDGPFGFPLKSVTNY